MENNEKKSVIDSEAIGVEISWSFGGGDADAVKLPRDRVRELFVENGFADYIGEKDEVEALKHAAEIARPGKGFIVRQMARPRKDTPIAFGVYVATTVEGERGDDIDCGARVRFDGGRAVCLSPEGKNGDALSMAIGDRIAKAANDLFGTVYNKDISNALLALGASLNWISRRRNKGGVYFLLSRTGTVEADQAEKYVALLRSLRDLSKATSDSETFNVEIIEVYPRPLSNETISASAKAEFETEVARLERDLDQLLNKGNMRESTIEKRADECDAIIRRAEQYRLWLAETTDAISSRLSAIRDQFKAAFESAAAGASANIAAIKEIEGTPAETAPLPEKPKGGRKPASEWSDKPFDTSFFDFDAVA